MLGSGLVLLLTGLVGGEWQVPCGWDILYTYWTYCTAGGGGGGDVRQPAGPRPVRRPAQPAGLLQVRRGREPGRLHQRWVQLCLWRHPACMRCADVADTGRGRVSLQRSPGSCLHCSSLSDPTGRCLNLTAAGAEGLASRCGPGERYCRVTRVEYRVDQATEYTQWSLERSCAKA